MNRTHVIAMCILLAGCLKQDLRHPTEDHAVQTRVVADACAADEACPERLQEDTEETAVQACLIHAIVVGTDGAHCAKAEG